jgi:hypothetical protein
MNHVPFFYKCDLSFSLLTQAMLDSVLIFHTVAFDLLTAAMAHYVMYSNGNFNVSI